MGWAYDFFEHFPIVGTILHIASDWKGGETSDYESCKVTQHTCLGMGKPIAEQDCRNCIDVLMMKYQSEVPGPSIVKGIMEALAVGTLTTVALKVGLKKGAAKLLLGGGLLIAADVIVDLSVWWYRREQIEKAAKAAKLIYCVCPDSWEGEAHDPSGEVEEEQ